jgi:Flp pilus assembly protein TadG
MKKMVLPEKGQVIILVSILLSVLLATLALVVDVGELYLAKRKLQAACDAASLAAAVELAENKNEQAALDKAKDYLAKNYASATLTGFSVTGTSIQVKAKTKVASAFSRLFGYQDIAVAAKATASFGTAAKVSRLVPFIVPYQQVISHIGPTQAGEFEFGDDRPLTPEGTVEKEQKGFFWLTDFNSQSGGTPDFADWIVNGYPGEVAVGSLANGEGVRSALKSALEQRLSRDRTLILPVYDYTENSGSNGIYHVIGFVEFYLQDFKLNGQPKTISGYFTNGTVTPGASGAEALDLGVKTVWLQE